MNAMEAWYKMNLMRQLAREGVQPMVLLLMFLYIIAPDREKFRKNMIELKEEFTRMKI